MNGAIPPLPQYSFIGWCSVKKHREDFTFYLLCEGLHSWLFFFFCRRNWHLSVTRNKPVNILLGVWNRIDTVFPFFLLSLAPQPTLGHGLLHKSGWISWRLLNNFLFYRVGLLAPRPTSIPEDQASVFISPRGRVVTHFSRLLRHAWVTVGLILFPGHLTIFPSVFHIKWQYVSEYETKNYEVVQSATFHGLQVWWWSLWEAKSHIDVEETGSVCFNRAYLFQYGWSLQKAYQMNLLLSSVRKAWRNTTLRHRDCLKKQLLHVT
jgi:hypothetical protein